MPDLVGRGLERRDKMRVAMAQRIDGNAGMEVEEFSAVLVIQAHALAPLEGEIGPGIGAVERRHGEHSSCVSGQGRESVAKLPQKPKTRPLGRAFGPEN
ncbi:hypothetical protein D3C71_2004230 [compost metagenome]